MFSRITILELNLPAKATGEPQQDQEAFSLHVIVRAAAIEVGDRAGGLVKRLEATAAGHDYAQLSELLQQIKAVCYNYKGEKYQGSVVLSSIRQLANTTQGH